nr:MAG TPA: hypothetical protein [Caudoviricetes sp.]DAM38563.1 MAG TPA: hypothetical protein [Caudoviricetes sp.]
MVNLHELSEISIIRQIQSVPTLQRTCRIS